jgi:predicted AAA+ superfamily ATPase
MTDTPLALFPRFSTDQVRTALGDTPVVMVVGPRQCGKTTLVRDLLDEDRAYLTLDDETVLEAAKSDPTALVRGLDRVVIDEVQRHPDLLRAIKLSVDSDRRPGRFLLTGSANVLALPQLSESLAGRMAVVELLTLSQLELSGHQPTFLRSVLAGIVPQPAELRLGVELVETVLTGGFPEMIRRTDWSRRRAWARDYVNTLVRRDVSDIAEVERQRAMLRLFRLLSHHSGQLTNYSQLSGSVGLDDKTARRYVGILENLFVLQLVEPWFRNRLKRVVKSPKLHFLDSGLLGALLGLTPEKVESDRSTFGPVLESFVFAEIRRQSAWLEDPCHLAHYRDREGYEVDIVVEDVAGGVVGIEVKASATVQRKDFKGMERLAGAVGAPFRLGMVLYDGEQVLPFGEGMFAVPISCLWAKEA